MWRDCGFRYHRTVNRIRRRRRRPSCCLLYDYTPTVHYTDSTNAIVSHPARHTQMRKGIYGLHEKVAVGAQLNASGKRKVAARKGRGFDI